MTQLKKKKIFGYQSWSFKRASYPLVKSTERKKSTNVAVDIINFKHIHMSIQYLHILTLQLMKIWLKYNNNTML